MAKQLPTEVKACHHCCIPVKDIQIICCLWKGGAIELLWLIAINGSDALLKLSALPVITVSYGSTDYKLCTCWLNHTSFYPSWICHPSTGLVYRAASDVIWSIKQAAAYNAMLDRHYNTYIFTQSGMLMNVSPFKCLLGSWGSELLDRCYAARHWGISEAASLTLDYVQTAVQVHI